MRSAPPPRRQQIVLIVVMTGFLLAILASRDRCGKAADGLLKALDAPAARDGGAPRG